MLRLSLVVGTEVGSRLARIEPAAKFDRDADWNNGLLPVSEHARETHLIQASTATRLTKGASMRIVYQRCCGLDVHKDSVTACLLLIDDDGEFHVEKRRFGTMTCDLRELGTWLKAEGVERVAMEATGVYWKPVWNILEPLNFDLLLVNAQHIKNVPGRKTDQKDSEWIADLLQHGLLRGSFVPTVEIRQLRDLTRMRARMRQDLATYANRIQKVLEDANIKLGSVASDVLGVSGRHMLKALISGQQDPKQLAALARGRLREKNESLQLALDGHFTDHHRFQLILLFDLLEHGETQMAKLESEIHRLLNQAQCRQPGTSSGDEAANAETNTLQAVVHLWKTIPGIDDLTASMLVAEIGPNMEQFPSAQHLAKLGGAMSRQQRERRKAPVRKDPEGQRVAAPRTLSSCVGRFTSQRHVLGCTVPPDDRTTRQEENHCRGRTHDACHCLSSAQTPLRLSRSWRRLLRPAGPPGPAAAPRQ